MKFMQRGQQLHSTPEMLVFIAIFFVLCGVSVADREKVFHGNFTTGDAFNYEVSIKVPMSQGSRICGGAIISELSVLTAAHCTYGKNKFIIGWGTNELRNPLKSVTANVSIEHSEYRPWFNTHDIAIIKLPQKVTTYNINPVRLPTALQNRNKFVNVHALIAGYGKTSNYGAVSELLNYANMTVISNELCGKTFTVTSTMLCATSKTQGVCAGDSGSPLTVKRSDGEQTIIGIVNFGAVDGCDEGSITVFARVSEYLDWIARALKL